MGKEEDRDVHDWVQAHFADPANNRNLIAVLLRLQERFGYLPKSGLRAVAEAAGLSPASVYGVATFYNQFRFVPPGKYPVKVCMGTACYIKQAKKIMEHFEKRLEIKEGEVTADREYSLDRVACVGCCTLAPVAVVGTEVIGDMAPTKVDGLLLQHQLKKGRKV